MTIKVTKSKHIYRPNYIVNGQKKSIGVRTLDNKIILEISHLDTFTGISQEIKGGE